MKIYSAQVIPKKIIEAKCRIFSYCKHWRKLWKSTFYGQPNPCHFKISRQRRAYSWAVSRTWHE